MNLNIRPKGLAPVAVNSIHSTFNKENDFNAARDKSVGLYNPNVKNYFAASNILDYSNAPF